jgi:hypothetical protein
MNQAGKTPEFIEPFGQLANATVVYVKITNHGDGWRRYVPMWTDNARLASIWPI